MAQNVIEDDRVSGARAGRFLDRLDGLALVDALSESKKDATVEFSDPTLNLQNITSSPRIGVSELRGDTRLVTIQRLDKEVLEALKTSLRTNRLGSSRTSSNKPNEPTIADDWLEEHAGPSLDEAKRTELQKRLASAIEAAYPMKETSAHSRVIWVGLANEFEPHQHLGAGRWLEVFGLGHFLYDTTAQANHDRQWFVAVKYTIADVAIAARPCVLEAGSNPWHYPTPSHIPAAKGGKTMILGEVVPDRWTNFPWN